MNNKYSLIPSIFITTLFFICGGAFYAMGGHIVFDKIDYITVAVVLLYCLCIILSISSNKFFSLLIPFVLIAFPSNINNIFPGVYLENLDLGVIYPLFNHIEVYLIVMLIFKRNRKDHFKYRTSLLTIILLFSFLLSTLINTFYANNLHEVGLLISGLYPVRLLILITLLIKNTNINFDLFIKGISISILFLFVEATVHSNISNLDGFTSGSLGTNTFGNIMGQMSIMLLVYIFLKKHKTNKFLYLAVVVGFIAMILTGTRIAIIASLFMLTLVIFPMLKFKNRILLVLLLSIFLLVFGYNIFTLMEKFDSKAIYNAINISDGELYVEKNFSTSSILTRLDLWSTSFRMLSENIATGIGWNLFNIEKYKYGFNINVIIDSHNGYLLFLSQLGISGLFWIYFIYIYMRIKFFSILHVLD